MDNLLPIIIISILAIWLINSIIVQFAPKKVESALRRYDLFSLLPRWSFSSRVMIDELGVQPQLGDLLNPAVRAKILADQIDFLLRDAFYTGVAHGIIDLPRLLSTFRVAEENLAVDRKGLSAMELVAVLTKVVQRQEKQLEEQRRRLDALERRLDER